MTVFSLLSSYRLLCSTFSFRSAQFRIISFKKYFWRQFIQKELRIALHCAAEEIETKHIMRKYVKHNSNLSWL